VIIVSILINILDIKIKKLLISGRNNSILVLK
jgi:hypothetical protein